MTEATRQAILADLALDELTTTQVAAKHGLDTRTLHNFATKHRVDIKHRTRKVWDRIRRDRGQHAASLLDRGMTVTQAASEMGLSHQTVRHALHIVGVDPQPATRPKKPDIPSKTAVVDAHLKRDDLRQTDIACIVGVSRQLVEQRMKLAGISGKERNAVVMARRRRVEGMAMKALWDDGLSAGEIASETGLSVGRTSRRLRDAGVNGDQIRARGAAVVSRRLREQCERGEAVGSKLTPAQVAEIKAWLEKPVSERNGETWQDLADRYGVTLGMLGHIKAGRAWAHVEARQ